MQNYKNVFVNPVYEGNAQEEQHQESESSPAAQPAELPEVAGAKSRMEALKGVQVFHAYLSGVIFFGVALNSLSNRSINKADRCNVTPEFGYEAIKVQVFSFLFFLFSTGAASLAERLCNTHKEKDAIETLGKFIRSPVLFSITFSSLIFSLIGGVFFIISMIDTLQFKIGKLSCQSADIYVLVVLFWILVSSVLLSNCYTVVHAFTYGEEYPFANFVNRKKNQD